LGLPGAYAFICLNSPIPKNKFGSLRTIRRFTKSSQLEKLTQQEEELMQVIWNLQEGNVKAFLEQMPDPKPPYTTLASTIKNLEKKAYVTSRLFGNTYLYKAVVQAEEYKQQFMQGFVQNYFNNSYKEMVNFFVSQKKLKPKELEEIIALIEENNK
jgi:BlaI family penicillinase repressor